MKKSTYTMLTQQASAVLILAAALGLSACNKAEEAKAPEVAATETAAPEVTPEAEVTPEPEVVPEAEVTPAPEVAATPEVTPAPETTDVAAAAPELSADAGKALYEKQCQACHAQGLLEAPKYGDKEAWAAHLAKGKDTLYEHSAKGFNKMPPQAVNGVSEAEIKAAVDYMIASVS